MSNKQTSKPAQMTKAVSVTDGDWSSIDFELALPFERVKYLRLYVAGDYLFFYIGDKPAFVEQLSIRSTQTVHTFQMGTPPPNVVTSDIAYAGATILTMCADEAARQRTFFAAPSIRFLRVNK